MQLSELVLSAERFYAIIFVLGISMVVGNTRSQLVMTKIHPIGDTYLGFTWENLSPNPQSTNHITKRLQRCDSDEVLVEGQTNSLESERQYSFFSNLDPDSCYEISIALYSKTSGTQAFSQPLSQKTANRPPEAIPESFTASFSTEDGQVHIESRPLPDESQEVQLCCLFPSSGDFSQVNTESTQWYDDTNRYMRLTAGLPYQPEWPEEYYKCIKLDNDVIAPETIDVRCIGENNAVVLAARFKQIYSNLVTGDSREKEPYIGNYTQYSLFSTDTPLDLSEWKSGPCNPCSNDPLLSDDNDLTPGYLSQWSYSHPTSANCWLILIICVIVSLFVVVAE